MRDKKRLITSGAGFLIIVAIVIATLIGIVFLVVGNMKNNSKQKELQIELNDDIEAKAKIIKKGKNKSIMISFNRQKQDTKVNVVLEYYKDDKIIYNENIIYSFPDKDTDCIMNLDIKTKKITLIDKDAMDTKNYNADTTILEELKYDYLKLIISKYKK